MGIGKRMIDFRSATAGLPDDPFLIQLADGTGRQIILTDMDSIGLDQQGHIGPVIDKYPSASPVRFPACTHSIVNPAGNRNFLFSDLNPLNSHFQKIEDLIGKGSIR